MGGAIFGDVHYREHYRIDVAQALTVLATVTSRPDRLTRIIILDAGRKAMPPDIARARADWAAHRSQSDDLLGRAS